MHSRPCGGADDLAHIFEFCRANITARLPGRSLWHPGDIAWQLTAVEGRALAANVRLWSDAEGVAGVAIFEPPLNVTFDLRAGIADGDALAVGILEWAEARRRRLLERKDEDVPIAYAMLGKGTLAVTAVESDAERIADANAPWLRAGRARKCALSARPRTAHPGDGVTGRHAAAARHRCGPRRAHRPAPGRVVGVGEFDRERPRLPAAAGVAGVRRDARHRGGGRERPVRELLHLLGGRADGRGYVRTGRRAARVHRPRPRGRLSTKGGGGCARSACTRRSWAPRASTNARCDSTRRAGSKPWTKNATT